MGISKYEGKNKAMYDIVNFKSKVGNAIISKQVKESDFEDNIELIVKYGNVNRNIVKELGKLKYEERKDFWDTKTGYLNIILDTLYRSNEPEDILVTFYELEYFFKIN